MFRRGKVFDIEFDAGAGNDCRDITPWHCLRCRVYWQSVAVDNFCTMSDGEDSDFAPSLKRSARKRRKAQVQAFCSLLKGWWLFQICLPWSRFRKLDKAHHAKNTQSWCNFLGKRNMCSAAHSYPNSERVPESPFLFKNISASKRQNTVLLYLMKLRNRPLKFSFFLFFFNFFVKGLDILKKNWRRILKKLMQFSPKNSSEFVKNSIICQLKTNFFLHLFSFG